ncbi:hypothetical protein QBC47DRAFT_380283 [Echria macrotheca]|uniref:Methyltransferase n=1 Tax=Echria macrotheca TaxID=438768 RepID=A0AAJ0FAT0_9PEZI|nr:hypothetical protein QBC47DRAFT_380283 [Echria macrotheca]
MEIQIQQSTRKTSDLHTKIWYLSKDPKFLTEKPFYSNIPFNDPEAKQTNVEMVQSPVNITNIRGCENAFTLEKDGFQLVRVDTDMPKVYHQLHNPIWVQDSYYPVVQGWLTEVLGRDKVQKIYIYDHTVRHHDPSRPPGSRGTDGALQPVPGVHVDHTVDSGPLRVQQHIPEPEASRLMKKRFQIINVWQPLFEPIQDWPLALCSSSSVPQNEFVETDLVYPHYYGEIYSLTENPKYRWYYAKDQTTNEVWMFKNYDSDSSCPARFTPHCSFVNPEAPLGARPRESIEFRVLVFFR